MEEHLVRAAFEDERMGQPPYHLDSTRRDAVLQAIQGVCAHRGWTLVAAHVRRSRAYRGGGGGTRWLWKPPHLSAAIRYVVVEQGDAMSVFEAQYC